jgi:peroxiredoxin
MSEDPTPDSPPVVRLRTLHLLLALVRRRVSLTVHLRWRESAVPCRSNQDERLGIGPARSDGRGAQLPAQWQRPPLPPRTIPGLPIGVTAPVFALPALSGETVTLDTLRAEGRPVMLLFIDPRSDLCRTFLPEVGRWQREHGNQLTLAVISRGTVHENRAKCDEHGVARVLLQQDREVADLYDIHGIPCAVVVHPRGTIASPLAPGLDAVRVLLARVLNLPIPPPVPFVSDDASSIGVRGLQVGTPAPSFALPDISGQIIELEDLLGRSALLLFWDADCRFCQQMRRDLLTWQARRPNDTLRLVVVSSGAESSIARPGPNALVLVDPAFSIGRRYGACGTPMAVLIDAEGKIGSHVEAGAASIWALLGLIASLGIAADVLAYPTP